MRPSRTVRRSPRRRAATRSASRSMAGVNVGVGGGMPASILIFTAGCTPLILRPGPVGCMQPKPGPAGFNGNCKGYLENLTMSIFWIPILSIVLGIGIAMLGLWTDHQRRTQKLEHLHRERMAAIEKGITLPEPP